MKIHSKKRVGIRKMVEVTLMLNKLGGLREVEMVEGPRKNAGRQSCK